MQENDRRCVWHDKCRLFSSFESPRTWGNCWPEKAFWGAWRFKALPQIGRISAADARATEWLNAHKFHWYVRMSIEQFDYLLRLIGPHIARQNTNCIPHHMQIYPRARLAQYCGAFRRKRSNTVVRCRMAPCDTGSRSERSFTSEMCQILQDSVVTTLLLRVSRWKYFQNRPASGEVIYGQAYSITFLTHFSNGSVFLCRSIFALKFTLVTIIIILLLHMVATSEDAVPPVRTVQIWCKRPS